MKKLAVSEFAFPAPGTPGIGEKNTVSNGPDDGTLNCNTSHFWSCMRHGTTQQAIDNGLTASIAVTPSAPKTASAGGLNIGGHGNRGQVETGMGQTGPYDDNKILLPWNSWAWAPQFTRLKPSSITYVSLWACHPGEGQQGSDLLYALAVECGRAVRGPTGFLYCNAQNLWLENGAVWQVATPVNKPAPINAPTPHSIFTTGATPLFEIEGHDANIDNLTSVKLVTLAYGRETQAFEAHDIRAQHLVRSLFLSTPLDLSDTDVPGLITGSVSLSFSTGQVAVFDVINDRLAVDRATRTGYYINDLSAVINAVGR